MLINSPFLKGFKFHVLPRKIGAFYNRLYYPAVFIAQARPFAYTECADCRLPSFSLNRESRYGEACRRNTGINYSAIRWDRYLSDYRHEFMISEFELGECF